MSSSSTNESALYFTHDWVITVPSHPALRILRCNPALFDASIAISSDPANSPFSAPAVRGRKSDKAAKEADKEQMLSRYLESPAKQDALSLLVELDGNIVGSGTITAAKICAPKANVGLQFISSARGRGLGKLTMRLLLRLSNELNVEGVRVGTMKDNLPLRGLMKSLGLEETEETFEVPVFGVVNDVLYNGIKKEDWKHFDFQVEFLKTGPGVGSDRGSPVL